MSIWNNLVPISSNLGGIETNWMKSSSRVFSIPPFLNQWLNIIIYNVLFKALQTFMLEVVYCDFISIKILVWYYNLLECFFFVLHLFFSWIVLNVHNSSFESRCALKSALTWLFLMGVSAEIENNSLFPKV